MFQSERVEIQSFQFDNVSQFTDYEEVYLKGTEINYRSQTFFQSKLPSKWRTIFTYWEGHRLTFTNSRLQKHSRKEGLTVYRISPNGPMKPSSLAGLFPKYQTKVFDIWGDGLK